MWRVVLLVFCYYVVSQAQDETIRHTRELIECCPCPGSVGPDLSRLRSSDDCPCRPRGADSEGASSMLFPSRVNPKNSVPFMRSNDPNDIKNLLEPEVGLAKSMLQTLREATEEEYRDALARDAARSTDTIPEESARNVVIIVKPRASDDEDLFVPEASNVKEARCINPLGSLGQMRSASKPLRPLPDFFRFPKSRQPVHRNLWDMDSNVGASNLQPSVVDVKAESKPRLPLFKFRTPFKENPLRSSTNEGHKTPSVLDKLEQTFKNRPNLFERFNLPHVPNMRVDSPFKNNNKVNTDLKSAPSINQEFIDKENDEGIFKENKKPPLLKNLLKLKDVELIPKHIPKLPVFKSKLDSDKKLAQPISLNRDADDTCEDSNYDSAMNDKVLMPKQVSSKESLEEKYVIDKDLDPKEANTVFKPMEDQNDAMTSPSEIIPSTMSKNTEDSDETDCNDVASEEMSATTEVSKLREEDESSELINNAVESEIEENDNDNLSKYCESKEVSHEENEVSDSNTDSSNNVMNVILADDNKNLLLIENSEKDVILPDDDNKDLSSFRGVEDKAQIINIPIPETIDNKVIPNIKLIPPLSATLSAIKENVKNSVEGLKKSSKIVTTLFSSAKGISSDSSNETLIQNEQAPHTNELKETPDADSKLKAKENEVTFKDLQKLSNDLLVLSSNNEKTFTTKETATEEDVNKENFKSNSDQQQTLDDERDSMEVETSTRITDENAFNDAKVTSTKGKACKVGFDKNETKREHMQSKSATLDEEHRDMSVEASAPKAITLPTLLDPLNLNEQLELTLLHSADPLNLNEKLGSPMLPNFDPLNLSAKLSTPILPNLDPLNLSLGSSILDPLNLNEKLSFLQPNLDPLNVRSSLQNIIVQPTIADDPLNILGKPIGEALKLPTLEDLRQRLSSVFDSNDRSAENNFSDEDTHFTNEAPIEMEHAASTNSLRKIPTIKPLENINVDIFQLNPLSNSDLLSNTPRLNLNNFRTKLPIPNNLDLKPVKLESRVTNNKGNVLGASLSFGNDKMLRKAKPKASKLGHPSGGLPSLDELRHSLQSNTQSLLGSPLHSNLDLFKDSSLRASGIPDIDEIRRNAEKTMKGLQQRMKSTFKGGKIGNPLGETFARPQDLLEDMNDKLKAIHYDLNDRLSSIHEDILDQTRLKPLTVPHLPAISPGRNNNHNKVNVWKPKGKPARLQTSASTISSQEIDPFENMNDKNLLRSSARNSPKRIPSSAQRTLLGAESSPVATKVEFPTHRTTPSKSTLPPLLRLPSSRHGSENRFPATIRKPLVLPRQPGFVKDLKRPVFTKPSPFKDKTNKVTITFATTTASPVTSPMNKDSFTTPTIMHSKPDIFKNNRGSLKERLALPRTKTIGDVKESASNIKPNFLTSKSTLQKNNFKTAISDKDFPQPQNVESTKLTKTRFPSFKDTNDNQFNENTAKKSSLPWSDKLENKNVEVLTEKNKAKPLVWPKTGEDSFLAKVREAMQARLNSFNPVKPVEKEEIPKVESTDMIKSASENRDIVVVDEPLKENVSYKCRMVCTRE